MIEINKIYNENCLDTMSRMEDNFIDLTVTSPPYDNLRTYNGYEFDFESIAKELFRVTKKGGVVVWVVGDATINGSETGTSFKQALYFKEIGFNLHDTMIYKSNKPPLTHNRYEQCFEYMFVFTKQYLNTFNPLLEKCIYAGSNNKRPNTLKGSRAQNSAMRTRNKDINNTKDTKYINNVWDYKTGDSLTTCDNFAFEHPAMFPEKLAQDHIYSWSDKGDLVYDCFTGSGTTLKMAIKQDRNFIGSEISGEYCKIAQKRIDNELQKIKMF